MDEKNTTPQKFSQWLLLSISLIGCLYLLAIPLGLVDRGQRFGATEAALFLVLLLLNSGFFQRLTRLGISDKGVDLELQVQMQKVQVEQQRQKEEIATLRFLISYFVTDYELSHLQKLAQGEPFPYTKSTWFVSELRRLRASGFIEPLPGTTLKALPEQGDLRTFFKLSERGKQYLQLRKQLVSE